MLVPVLCLTCGLPIGDKDDLFRHMMETVGVSSEEADAGEKPAGKLTPQEILELLGVHYDCCRAHLVTAMNFLDHY